MIGVQIEGKADNKIQWIGKNSFVVLGILWSEVEATRGVYKWPKQLDTDFRLLTSWPVLLNIRNSPEWARIYQTCESSAPCANYVPNFVEFVCAVMERYHPEAVSIWREPDVSAAAVKAAGFDHYFGGFGVELARYYGKIIRSVYKETRAHKTMLVAGELMLDDAAFWKKAMHKCSGHYDALAFHSYLTYPATCSANEMLRKIGLLRKVGEFGPLWCTETSYKCRTTPPENYEDLQASYLGQINSLPSSIGMPRIAWYTLGQNGWENSDLIKKGNKIGAAYNTYRAITDKL